MTQLEEGAVWQAYIKAWRATDSSGWQEPFWFDESKRTVLNKVPLRRRPSSYRQARTFVRALVEASSIADEEQRNDALRLALAGNTVFADAVPMATLVELVGRDAVELKVSVDSDAGGTGKEYDFAFTHRGNNFDVQGRVFGAEL